MKLKRGLSIFIYCGITLIGILWCIKQAFIPMTIVPMACGMGVIFLMGKLTKKKFIEAENMILLGSAGCFVTLNELSAFIVFCSFGSCLTYILQRYFWKTTTGPRFALSIVLSEWVTFFLYCC
jgi:hypothetical protein